MAEALKNSGYITRSTDFLNLVRQKLYELTQKGRLVKNGLQYKLEPKTLAEIQPKSPTGAELPGRLDLKEDIAAVSAVAAQPGLPDAAVRAEVQTKLNKIESAVADYVLLRQAVVDFAKSKNFVNPEAFPDTLIHQRREFLNAEKQYRSLIEGK